MTRYVQIDWLDEVYVVTAQLLTAGTLNPDLFPSQRRFIQMAEGDSTPVEGGSTVVIDPDTGEPIVPFDPMTITITPPPPPPPPPTADPTQVKLDRILKLLEEP
jgi:hypothetical protein